MVAKRAPNRSIPPKSLSAVKPSETSLEKIRGKLREARDHRLSLANCEEIVSQVKKDIHTLERIELPELFQQVGIDHLGLPPEGNLPGYDATLSPYYRANIAASWDAERRAAAFAELEKRKAGDLIKSTITIRLPKKSEKIRKQITKFLDKLKVEYECKLDVSHGSLTAWLRHEIEKNSRIPPLDTIGGEYGSIVKMNERKD